MQEKGHNILRAVLIIGSSTVRVQYWRSHLCKGGVTLAIRNRCNFESGTTH